MMCRLLMLLVAALLVVGDAAQCGRNEVRAQGAATALPDRKGDCLPAGTAVTQEMILRNGVEAYFSSATISDDVFARMRGKSYPKDCTTSRHSLRYLRVLHYDAQGVVRIGEMVCHQTISKDLLEIFRELYNHRYPIERMLLIDEYAADDELSMRADNTSCFCFRRVSRSAKLSKHAQGLAVDINPLYNPYYKKSAEGRELIQPANARAYLSRNSVFPYKISKNDLCYRLFIKHGFRWGGDWKTVKDYQHFEK